MALRVPIIEEEDLAVKEEQNDILLETFGAPAPGGIAGPRVVIFKPFGEGEEESSTQDEALNPVNNREIEFFKGIPVSFGSTLPSQELNRFQLNIQRMLSRITMGMASMMNWVVLDEDSGAAFNKLDAVLTEDNSGSPADLYNHRHGALGDAQAGIPATPKFPTFFTFSSGDRIYYGSRFPIRGLTFGLGTPDNTSNTWQYYNGSWTNLSGVSGIGADYSVDGNVTWTFPTDWELVDGNTAVGQASAPNVTKTELFWVRSVAGASGATLVINEVSLAPVFSDYLLVEQETTTSVRILPGLAIVNRNLVRNKEYQVVSLSSFLPSADTRYVVIHIDEFGVTGTTAGTEGASPNVPEPPENAMTIGQVLLNTTSISSIQDARILWHTPT